MSAGGSPPLALNGNGRLGVPCGDSLRIPECSWKMQLARVRVGDYLDRAQGDERIKYMQDEIKAMRTYLKERGFAP